MEILFLVCGQRGNEEGKVWWDYNGDTGTQSVGRHDSAHLVVSTVTTILAFSFLYHTSCSVHLSSNCLVIERTLCVPLLVQNTQVFSKENKSFVGKKNPTRLLNRLCTKYTLTNENNVRIINYASYMYNSCWWKLSKPFPSYDLFQSPQWVGSLKILGNISHPPIPSVLKTPSDTGLMICVWGQGTGYELQRTQDTWRWIIKLYWLVKEMDGSSTYIYSLATLLKQHLK